MWIIDAYRNRNELVLWIKDPENKRITVDFKTCIYMDTEGKDFLEKRKIEHKAVKKQNYLSEWKDVLEIHVKGNFESFVNYIEKGTKHRIALYNADITPEQMYFYANNFYPGCQINNNIELTKTKIKVIYEKSIKKIIINDKIIEGNEKEILEKFVKEFGDPDVIIMENAFAMLPLLAKRLDDYKIKCDFHRWDASEIKYKGGRSYWSYGQVRYQNYPVRLHGRLLVDSSSFIGSECEFEAIMELAELSNTLLQQTASRSFGAVFQSALVREMVKRDMLVPYKEKPIEEPLSMQEMLKHDRAGHTADPKLGFHKNVAELDFTSMFPWLIYNKNISPEAKGNEKGLIPTALKPFIDRRMHYKKIFNKQRAKGLKWVLVSCYGYLRYREFKLGIASSHMTICAHARETLLESMKIVEGKGYKIVHAIIDSLYISKRGINEEEVNELRKEIEQFTGIPISFEGIFKWVVFLPSINDSSKPVPARYFGVYMNGDIKARGIELRQRNTPLIVSYFQHKVLEIISRQDNEKRIKECYPELVEMLKKVISSLHKLNADWLAFKIRITTNEYRKNIPQRKIVERLKRKGVNVMPGHIVRFVFQKNKAVLAEEYNGKPDIEIYRKHLVRALYTIMQPFGFSRYEFERQTRLNEYVFVKQVYIPISKKFACNKGLSEKIIRKRLEKQGWKIWKPALINIINMPDIYPNVMKKYLLLNRLLEKKGFADEIRYYSFLAGMPDYIAYRHGKMKFVECKFLYEKLSERQRRCIGRLQKLGFEVEVHRIAGKETKTRVAHVNLINGKKVVKEKQIIIRQLSVQDRHTAS